MIMGPKLKGTCVPVEVGLGFVVEITEGVSLGGGGEVG